MQKEVSIVWFRQDLRIADNPAIIAASLAGEVLPIYIFDDCAPEGFKIGSASKVWLHHSLNRLNESLKGALSVYVGSSTEVIQSLIERYNVKSIFCNSCYEPWHQDQENTIREICKYASVAFEAFNGNYLYSPTEVLKDDGGYYKVFTAYKNKTRTISPRIATKIQHYKEFIRDTANATTIQDLKLLPYNPWYRSIESKWGIGEVAAQKKLILFVDNHLAGYKEGRNYPYKANISKLSPHLHFGEISPAQIIDYLATQEILHSKPEDVEHFISEIIWREFSCYLLYHFKGLHRQNFNSKFNNFAWEDSKILFQLWAKGKTGYPLIDAGMRELWQTGYMHNRVRMVVASFLIKNLNIDWRQGMNWFWDCLVDADLANNSASWQWVAGSGADAAPYFRIFNPITQGEKFDSDGVYTKTFVPELKNMPNKYLFKPWTAPLNVLKSANVTLGDSYPTPIVDFVKSRHAALEQYSYL